MPADFSRAGLVAEAGVDPWTLWEPLSQGAPDTVRTAGGHFRIAGEQAATAAQEGRDADLAMAAAYTSENQAVFDAPRSTGEGRVLLSDDGQLMEEAARIVIGIGDGLEEAQDAARTQIQGLGLDINETVERRNNAVVGVLMTQTELDAIDARYLAEAADFVRRRTATIQTIIDDFDELLVNRTGQLTDLGYEAIPAGTPTDDGGGIGGFVDDVRAGAGSAVGDTGDLLGMLNPVRAFTDGDAYWEDRARFAGELWQIPGALARDPLGTLDQLATGGNLGKGEYGRALGEVLGGAALGGFGRILGKADNLVPPGTTRRDPDNPTTHAPDSDPRTNPSERDVELGTDTNGQYRPGEAETARLLEEQGIPLRRNNDASVDWVGTDGKTSDAVGPFPARFFEREQENLFDQIDKHVMKADVTPVNVSQFTPHPARWHPP